MTDEAPDRPGPAARRLGFITTAQASLDARALLNARLNRLYLIGDGLAVVCGLGLALAGFSFGPLIAVLALALLTASQYQPLQRWIIGRSARSLLGRPIEVIVDGDGLRLSGELGATSIPWSSLTAVRSNARTVIFVRDRVLAGYVPASSFASPADQADLVRYADARIGMTRN